MQENLDGLPVISIWNLSPWWVLLVMVALFAIPALMRWREEGRRITDDHFLSLVRDLMLACAVFLLVLVAADTTPSQGAWHTTLWWYVPSLVVVLWAVPWLRGVRMGEGPMTIGGRRDDPELVKTVIYAFVVYWVVALVPAMLLANHSWSVPIQIVCFAGLFLMRWAFPRILQWANGVGEPPLAR